MMGSVPIISAYSVNTPPNATGDDHDTLLYTSLRTTKLLRPLALSSASLKPILWDGGRDGERRAMTSQPTQVSFHTNKKRWITETTKDGAYLPDPLFIVSLNVSHLLEINTTSAQELVRRILSSVSFWWECDYSSSHETSANMGHLNILTMAAVVIGACAYIPHEKHRVCSARSSSCVMRMRDVRWLKMGDGKIAQPAIGKNIAWRITEEEDQNENRIHYQRGTTANPCTTHDMGLKLPFQKEMTSLGVLPPKVTTSKWLLLIGGTLRGT
ncbi:unnamed protein product [Timema podura]|uniref:Uncharacterized protein n=1 Tax=Timema podura TaxID=61482 RepID=A0ABN7NSA2_TIMPD|nr:unnamed protein product [Timema podura]